MNKVMEERYGSRSARTSGWRQFLTPGWILGAIVIVLFSYFAFTWLAPWQLGKNSEINERNAQIEAAFNTDPVNYQEIFGPGGTLDPKDEWRRVTATGHFLADHESLLRMRPAGGGPAVHSLVPFQTTAGDTILTHRGYVSSEGNTIPEIAPIPTGEVTITAVARVNEPRPDRQPLHDDGYTQFYGINTEQIAETLGVDLGRDTFQLVDDQPGVLTPLPIPKLDTGSHLSYGLQWIAFGIMAPLGLGYFIWAELRERRRARSEAEEIYASEDASASASAESAPRSMRERLGFDNDEDLSTAPPPSIFSRHRTVEHSRSLADRYGDTPRNQYRKIIEKEEDRF
ncbi:SURF1 family cytochrome oxidase biogenesis protein [Corynebacterium renale]|nr:SURF1 family protein [Corynebacterium renale]